MKRSDWAFDIRHGFRLLWREPVASAAMIVTMVLGIGALAAVASLVYGVLLRPLPFPESDRIVRISRTDGTTPPSFAVVGLLDLMDWRTRSRTLSEVAGWTTVGATWVADDEASRIVLAEVTEGFDHVLGLTPALGRAFAPREFTPETANVLLLSHDFWRSSFAADPDVVGRTLVLDNVGHVVVGVLPELDLDYPDVGFDAWRPLARSPGHWTMRVRGASWLNAVGRVRREVSVDAAEAEMGALQAALAAEFPRSQESQESISLDPLKDVIARPARRTLLLLIAAVLGVLLIACLNLSVLLLARANRRSPEFSVRAALGGTGDRLRRQLFAESLVVACVGGVLGIVAAPVGLDLILALYPGGVPRAREIGVDWSIVLIAGAGVAVTTAITGVLPGLWGAGRGRDLRAGRDHRSGTGRSLLAGFQVAVSVVLLIGSTLLVQTLRNLAAVDPGFDGEGVVAFRVSPSSARYASDTEVERFYADLVERLDAVTWVETVGVTNFAPFTSGDWGHGFTVPGDPDDAAPAHPANVRITRDGYYAALRVPLVAGRLFEARDDAGAAPVAMLNVAAAEEAFEGEDPVGRTVQFEGELREIVGVVGDVQHRSLAEPAAPEIHVPARQAPPRTAWVVVRATAGATRPSMREVRSAVHAADPTVAIVDPASYELRMADVVAPQRFRAAMVTGLGVLAALIAWVGVYGTMSNVVVRMVREIGIRMALGEEAGSVLRRVLRRAGTLALGGVALGAGVSLALSPSFAGALFGVSPTDPVTYLIVSGSVWIVSLVAALGPALRASRLDPVRIIKQE